MGNLIFLIASCNAESVVLYCGAFPGLQLCQHMSKNPVSNSDSTFVQCTTGTISFFEKYCFMFFYDTD